MSLTKVFARLGLVACVLACALACSACASAQLTVYSEPSLREATRVAIEAWNEALSKGPCPEVGLIATPDGAADVRVRVGDAVGYMGFTHDRLIVIDVDRHKSEASLEVTVSHELGHALGSEHSADPDDLMFPAPRAKRGPVPTGYDVARVCAYYLRGI